MAKAKRKKPRIYPGCPIKLKDGLSWFYTQKEGLLVVSELKQGDLYVGTTTAVVPWGRVSAAMKVHKRRSR